MIDTSKLTGMELTILICGMGQQQRYYMRKNDEDNAAIAKELYNALVDELDKRHPVVITKL